MGPLSLPWQLASCYPSVGQLLLAYSAGFLVLTLYLLFVPYGKEKKEVKKKEKEASRLTREMKGLIFILAIEAAVVVCTNTAITIRIPSLMVERGLGDAQFILVLFLVSCS